MSTLAQELDDELQKLEAGQARHLEQVVRGILALMREPAAPSPQESIIGKQPLPFPLIAGTPGAVINPSKEQLSDF